MLQRGNDRATEYPHSSGISTSSEGAVTKEIFINLDSDETDSESNETQSVDVTSYVDELLGYILFLITFYIFYFILTFYMIL